MHEDNEKNLQQENIAKEIESGVYFTKARRWYSLLFHVPIAERSYYIIVFFLAAINVWYGIKAFEGIFPLSIQVPFVTSTENINEDWPRIHKLVEDKFQNKNEAVMKYFIKEYVINRESYDLNLYELRYRNIWSISSDAVFTNYRNSVAADNILSPYHQYTNLARKTVKVESVSVSQGADISTAVVIFRTSVISTVNQQELGSAKWQVEMKYSYSNFKVDQRLNEKNEVALFFGLTENSLRENNELSKFTPMAFRVVDYKLKELLE